MTGPAGEQVAHAVPLAVQTAPPSPLESDAADYPASREADVILRDGSAVHVRPVRPEDEPALREFFGALSTTSRALRFFSAASDFTDVARRESHVDYCSTFSLVATAGSEGSIVGHGYYARVSEGRGDVAITIGDACQRRGLGTLLLGLLAEIAAANGIHAFDSEVLATNQQILEVLRESGFDVQYRREQDVIHVTIPTTFREETLNRFDERDQVASVNALHAFLAPRSVAVIGASRHRGTVGGEVFHNLVSYGFNGPVYPVNPSAGVVQSSPAFPSVEAIPGPVDLAVVAVPAECVLSVVEECGRKGVRAVLVLSAGFGECGEAGRARQAELVRLCRDQGMRLVGPNCIGVINTDSRVRLNAIFGPLVPPEGRVGFASQSGALGLTAIDYAAGARGLGTSSFVSVGNKADISTNDLLSYWESDPRTDVILLYVESFGNPRKFSRIARRVGRTKPIVAVKSGRSAAGARASSSHTGALLAASDVTVDALFRQAGVIRTDTLEELFDVASLLATQPLPAGRRVAIVTNVGGPGILCADACEAQGLCVPVLAPETQARLREFLAAEASPTNPVDMIATATAEQYRQAVETVADDPNVDAVIAIFLRPLTTRAEDVAAALADAARSLARKKPLLSVFTSAEGAPRQLAADDLRVPAFTFPEAAAIALAHAARYAEWRAHPYVPPPYLPDVRRDEARAVIANALARGAGWLEPDEVWTILDCYGIPRARQRLVGSASAAGQAAAGIGGAVALKAVVPGLLHKSEAGAVALGLQGARAVRAAASAMSARLEAAGHRNGRYLVQQMVPRGVEMLVGLVHDPHFGPVLACGAGGTMVEVLRDVSVRLTPLTEPEAAEMLRSLRSFPLLTGFRGAPPADVAALEDVLLRASALAEDQPEIAEMDCNPVIALEHGAVVVDARIRVERATPPLSVGARR